VLHKFATSGAHVGAQAHSIPDKDARASYELERRHVDVR